VGAVLTFLVKWMEIKSKWPGVFGGCVMAIGARGAMIISIIYLIEIESDGVMGPIGI